MADLKYLEVQIVTHFDGSKDRLDTYKNLETAHDAEVRFEKNMGNDIAGENNKTVLNIALSNDGEEVAGCNEFYSKVPTGTVEDVIKYYHIMWTTKVDETADSIDVKAYDDYETAEISHHVKMGAALDNDNTKTALSKIYNSHGGAVMSKYRDLYPEPEPPIPPVDGE